MAVKDRLEERRKRLGLEQKEAARTVGIGYQYWYKLEKGTNNPPTWKILVKLAKGLQTSADYILELTDDPTPAAERAEWTPEAIAAARLINTAPPAKRDGALAVLKAAVELTQAETVDTAAAPANGGGVTLLSQQESGGQSNLSVEKDTWLALFKTALSPEDYKRLEDSVNRGEMPTQTELTRLIEASKHNPLPKGTERLNNHDLVN